MNFFEACLLGMIEGITEFLPISSTGHLIVAAQALHIPSTVFLTTFEISIQLGAILAVVVLYARRLWIDRQLLSKVLWAFVPTGVIGFLLHDAVTALLHSGVVAWSLLLGGVVFIALEMWYVETPPDDTTSRPLSWRQAFLLGVCQTLALIPGVSRSGATIAGGLLMKLPRVALVEFSFLLAIPTMLGATFWSLYASAGDFARTEWSLLAVGFVSAFIVAIGVVRSFLRYIKHHTFFVFGVYRIAAGLALLMVL